MSDGQLSVTVNDLRGHEVELKLGVDDRGHTVFQSPPPGYFDVDPERQMPDLQNVLELLRQAGLKTRRKLGEPS